MLALLARRARIYKPKCSGVVAQVAMKNIAYEYDQTDMRDYAASPDVP